MAKKKPLKKDRLAKNHLKYGEKKQPFYLEAQQKQNRSKPKKNPFGDEWEIAQETVAPGEYQAECIALDEDGNGVIRVEGVKLSVPAVLPGEQITVEVWGKKKPHAKLIQVQKASKDRVKAKCPVFYRCGGCRLQHMSYDAQLDWKQKQVERLMQEYIGKGAKFYQIIGMEQPWNYRNKSHTAFAMNGRQQIVSGIYEENSHRVVPTEHCLIQSERADRIIRSIRQIMKECKLLPYDEDSETGLLRHVLIREGFTSGEVMVVLVTASMIFPARSRFVSLLREKHPEITTIVMNCNPKKTSMVLGEQERILYGKGWIEDSLCQKTFAISPKSFYQVNPVQTQALYQRALQMAALTGKERVLDAYCGIGTIGIAASPEAKEVIGVELNPDAVRDAVTNAKVNGVKNIRFYCNDAGKFMVQMASQGGKADVVFMDPPRSGSTEEFINAVATLKPVRVVYVSCGPDTLARDLAVFKRKGYEAKEAWGVDMFPFTGHTECVVKLERAN